MPRIDRALVLTTLALLLLPSAGAATLLDDPAGDAYTDIQTVATTQSVPVTEQNIDLASLDFEEAEEGFTAHVAMHPDDGPLGTAFVLFWAGERQYAVRLDPDGSAGALYNVGPEGDRAFVAFLEPTAVDGLVMRQAIPRDLILDEDGSPPLRGSMLTDIQALASTFTSVNLVAIETSDKDVMPDAGPGAEWTVQEGPLQQGDAHLWSPRPSRSSNGAAATYVYEAFAENLGPDTKAFALSVIEAPDTWDVRVSRSDFVLAPGATIEAPVVVTIPFNHRHGGTETAVLRLEGEAGDVAELPLQVHFLTVPQPTGHHNTLWLHSNDGPPGEYDQDVLSRDPGYMNALQEDEGDTNQPMRGRAGVINALHIAWWLPLQPALETGIDMDLSDTGELSMVIESRFPVASGEVQAKLLLNDGNGYQEIAHVDPMPWTSGPGETAEFHGTVVPNASADLIHIDGQANMALLISASPLAPDQDIGNDLNAAILPGATLRLPLDEYRDPIEDALAEAPGLRIVADKSLHLRPADDYWIPVQVTNLADHDATYSVALSATQSGVVSAPPTLAVPANSKETMWLHVQAPEDDPSLDVVVHVGAPDNAGAYHRITFTFDTAGKSAEAYPEPLSASRDTPLPPSPLVVVLAFAMTALARRRRAHP